MHHLKRPLPFTLWQFLCLAILVAFTVMAAGCADMPTRARTFNDYAADTLQATDAAVSLTRTLLAARKITPDDAENMLKAAETARDGVAIARSVRAANGEAAGMSRIRLAAKAAEDLNRYLLERKGS